MATIAPSYLRDLRVLPDHKNWIVFASEYDGSCRKWKHRTASGALRRMGSVINGKLNRRGICNVAAVDPQGLVWCYNEIKAGQRRF